MYRPDASPAAGSNKWSGPLAAAAGAANRKAPLMSYTSQVYEDTGGNVENQLKKLIVFGNIDGCVVAPRRVGDGGRDDSRLRRVRQLALEPGNPDERLIQRHAQKQSRSYGCGICKPQPERPFQK